MYIEDLIKVVTLNLSNFISHRDGEILQSICDQLYENGSVTEKQGALVIRLLNNYRKDLQHVVDNIDNTLDNPNWKNPFRTLHNVKKITIERRVVPKGDSTGNCIIVKFPFNKEIVDELRSANSSVHPLHRGSFDQESKVWYFNLTEYNVIRIGDLLLPYEFQASEEFLKYYNECNNIRTNIDQCIPMLAYQNDQYIIKNAYKSIPQVDTNNLTEALFHARKYGITTWCDVIDEKINSKLNPLTKKVLLSNKKDRPWVNSENVSIDKFKDLLSYGGPVLIIVPGGSELELTKQWVNFAKSIGIVNSQISVMFRLPNEEASFNEYVKDQGLNNAINEDIRIVFVSTKITKPLIKSKIKFDTIINLGYYNYMHFSMSTIVDSVCNLVYYSMKEPTVLSKWQQQDL